MKGAIVGRWRRLFDGLGEALLELLAAELEALGRDVSRAGRGLLLALGLFAAAAAVGFWLVATLVAFVVALLSLWLPIWGATLTTAGILIALFGGLIGFGWWRLRRLDGPRRILERRWREHRAWWQERIVGERRRGGGTEV